MVNTGPLDGCIHMGSGIGSSFDFLDLGSDVARTSALLEETDLVDKFIDLEERLMTLGTFSQVGHTLTSKSSRKPT